MTTLPGPERVKELREWVEWAAAMIKQEWMGGDETCPPEIRAILDALPGLQAENAALKAEGVAMRRDYKIVLEQRDAAREGKVGK